MKKLFTIVLTVFVITTSTSQEKNIETKSVSINNLITFIVENYPNSTSDINNIFLLVQLPKQGLAIEEEIVLKQALKLLSSRLTEEDQISIIGYSGLNGIALKPTSAKDIKGMFHAVNDFQSSIKEFHSDGIAFTYEFAEAEFDEEAINTVIMVRNPNPSISEINASPVVSNKNGKKKNNAVLITAISLLPELIAIIKN